MQAAGIRINELILDQLGHGEMRLLVLVVAIRKALGATKHYKGDLSAAVSSALRKLVLLKTVVDNEGVYSLKPVE